ncbi:MAG: ECF transporter S component, partial [Oscillospiraceae bacterium]
IIPLLSFLITSMPPLYPVGVSMMFELAAYGIIAGLLYKKCNVFVSLIGAMLGGRIVYGLFNLIILGLAGTPYGMEAFLTSAFVTAFPGIVIQLILIPAVVIILEQTGFLQKKKNQA